MNSYYIKFTENNTIVGLASIIAYSEQAALNKAFSQTRIAFNLSTKININIIPEENFLELCIDYARNFNPFKKFNLVII